MDTTWTSVPIARIEDLRDAVYGAGLEATQMSTASLSGNLTFARRDDVLYCSGLIDGQVALRGPLSSDQITVGVGLRMGGGTRHWLEETASGAVGVFMEATSTTRSTRQARSMRRQRFRSTGWNSWRQATSLSLTGRPLGAPGSTHGRWQARRSGDFVTPSS